MINGPGFNLLSIIGAILQFRMVNWLLRRQQIDILPKIQEIESSLERLVHLTAYHYRAPFSAYRYPHIKASRNVMHRIGQISASVSIYMKEQHTIREISAAYPKFSHRRAWQVSEIFEGAMTNDWCNNWRHRWVKV